MFGDVYLNSQDQGVPAEMVFFPLEITSLIPVFLSAISTGTIVALSLIFKLYKRPLSLMILAINIAHVCFHFSKLSVLIFQPSNDFHCSILGIINIFGIESSAYWIALFAHAFYIVAKYKNVDAVPQLMKYYVIFAVILPLISAFSSYFEEHFSYSDTKGTCVHRFYPGEFDVWANIYVFIPVWIACISTIVWYKMAINKIAELRRGKAGVDLYVLMIYPCILILCWGPNLIVRAIMQFGGSVNETLNSIALFLVNMQGFFDALVYGKSVREELRGAMSNSCLKKKVSKESQVVDEQQNTEERSHTYSNNYLGIETELTGNRQI